MENLKQMIASCLERLRSRESQPRSLSKVDDEIFKSEKVIKRAAYFVVFGVSQIDTCCPIQSYSNQSKDG